MLSDLIWTLSLLLDALKDPFAFALLITVGVLGIGYYNKRHGLSFFASVALTFSATHITKSIFKTPRPDFASIDTVGYRFPSLHAAIAGALCASIWWYVWTGTASVPIRLCATIIAVGAIIFVAWSRVLLGVHVPVDVVVGALIGISVTLVIHIIGHKKSVVQ